MKKRKSKIIKFGLPFISGYFLKILFTNHLKLGFSLKRRDCYFFLNFFTCQFVFSKVGFKVCRNKFGIWSIKNQIRYYPLFIYFYL